MAEIKRTDVEALAGKLESFAKNLSEQESNVLGWILARAKNASADLSDADLDTVAGGNLADTLGFDAGQESVGVSWSLSKAK